MFFIQEGTHLLWKDQTLRDAIQDVQLPLQLNHIDAHVTETGTIRYYFGGNLDRTARDKSAT